MICSILSGGKTHCSVFAKEMKKKLSASLSKKTFSLSLLNFVFYGG